MRHRLPLQHTKSVQAPPGHAECVRDDGKRGRLEARRGRTPRTTKDCRLEARTTKDCRLEARTTKDRAACVQQQDGTKTVDAGGIGIRLPLLQKAAARRIWAVLPLALVAATLLALHLSTGPTVSRQSVLVGLVAALSVGVYVWLIARHADAARQLAARRLDELTKARDTAEAATRARSEFLARMSQEIRTPVNLVVGIAGLMLDTGLTDVQRQYADTLLQSAEAQLAVLNDILAFSRLEAGTITLEPGPCDLRRMVEDTADLLARDARRKGLELIVRYAPDTPEHVIADAGRVRQILNNLVGNAIKFTTKGYLLIDVDLDRGDKERQMVVIKVEDTGIGIEPERLDSIFHGFVQQDASTARVTGGTGLGLPIARRLAELMGGYISVDSVRDKGSAFRVALPLEPDSEPAPRRTRPVSVEKNLRALVVDDVDISRRVMAEQLRGWQIEVVACPTGGRALDALRVAFDQGRPLGAVLIDYLMPGMDGVALARAIRGDPDLAGTPLIMFSVLDREVGSEDQLEELGLVDFLVKPIRRDLLFDAVSSACTGADGDGPPPCTEAKPGSFKEGEESMTTQPTPRLSGIRVLIVDDNAVNQMVAKAILEKLGCRVDRAGDGSEALNMLAALPYDAVLMDCHMPVMDGYEATRRIREGATGAAERMPIIAMAANAVKDDRERCLAAGMDDYLSKPVDAESLISALERWVSADRIPGNSHQTSAGPEVHGGAGTSPDQQEGDSSERHPQPVISVSDGLGEQWPVIDDAALEDIRDISDGDVLIEELVELFIKNLPEQLDAIREAIEARDPKTMGRAAHKLKGGAGSIGARRIEMAALKLQALGVAGQLTGVDQFADTIEQESGRLEEWFATFREESKARSGR